MSALSKALLSFHERYGGDVDHADEDMVVPARTWAKWVELARLDERKKPKNPRCPYPEVHAADCTCDGAGGPR